MKYKIAAVILALGLSAGMSSYAMPKHRKHRGHPKHRTSHHSSHVHKHRKHKK